MFEVLEQIFVIEGFGVTVHQPDFGRGVLLGNNSLLCEKADFFEGEFVACVWDGYGPII